MEDINNVVEGDLSLNISSAPVPRKVKGHVKQVNCGAKFNKPSTNRSKKPVSEYDSGLNQVSDVEIDAEPLDGDNEESKSPYKKHGAMEYFKQHLKAHRQNRPSNQSDRQAFENKQHSIRKLPKGQYISSLFKSNPEIPHMPVTKVKVNKELLFTNKSFSELDLHPHLVSCLESRFKITKLTEVQGRTIPVLLDGKDALVKSCTGSGKTLAYAVPIVQKLQLVRPKIHRSSGIFALIILPTRELALQSFDCFLTLTKAFTWIVPGYLIGGEKKKSEKARIRKGINILIATPGRLLDHIDHTNNLDLSKIEWLVIDEGDKLLEQGFEEAVLKIVKCCSSTTGTVERQTALLSATLSRGVEKLAGISMKNPVCIDVSSSDGDISTMGDLTVPAQLKQFFVIVPTKLRLVTLAAFIVDKCIQGNTKALIFLTSQGSVEFHCTLFNDVLTPLLMEKEHNVKFFKLHGNMKQEDRSEVFKKFRQSEEGILLCTDVAARGLHLPHVDWIVQYNVPSSVEIYVHRVGRTARIGEVGHSLLFLIPSEAKFITLLQKHKLRLTEMAGNDIISSLAFIEQLTNRKSKQRCPTKAVETYATNLQSKFEALVYSEEAVRQLAKEAFVSDVQAYASYPKALQFIIPFKMLHLGHVAKSFCLREAPSELGCKFAKPARGKAAKRPGKSIRLSQKRKMLSEYDSGFDALTAGAGSMRKKFKKH